MRPTSWSASILVRIRLDRGRGWQTKLNGKGTALLQFPFSRPSQFTI